MLTAIYWYATIGNRFVDGTVDPKTRRFFIIRGLTIPLIFLLSVAISFFSIGFAIGY